jgi:hypothetical protein
VLFDDQRRTKPLRVILGVLTNPFTRPLGERSNEPKRSLCENPDVGFAGGRFHCLPSAFANGGSGLIGNSRRKTANVCDKHTKETTRKNATHFTRLLSSFFYGNREVKFSKNFTDPRAPLTPSNAIGYAKFRSHSHDAAIRVYD